MDYVYKIANDAVRVKIFCRENGWDFDVWERGVGYRYTYCPEMGESFFPTKRDAKAEAERLFGTLKSINVQTVNEGW